MQVLLEPHNYNSQALISKYYEGIQTRIDKIHDIILSNDNQNRDNYIWPCSMHTIYLFTFGLNHLLFKNVLDNSEAKINKYLYGYNLQCKSLNELRKCADRPMTVFINGGCFNRELLCSENESNIKYVFLQDL